MSLEAYTVTPELRLTELCIQIQRYSNDERAFLQIYSLTFIELNDIFTTIELIIFHTN